MNRPATFRFRLLAPLAYLAAVILIIEEWLWNTGARLMRAIAGWPPLHALERRIAALPPYAALCVFALPAVLLFPVKLLALFAIAKGHAVAGISGFIVAKVAGAAAVARLYLLTRPSLLTLPWLKRWHDGFIRWKDRWIGLLKETRAYQHCRMVATRLAWKVKEIRAGAGSGRHAWRSIRVLRKLRAMWQARRR